MMHNFMSGCLEGGHTILYYMGSSGTRYGSPWRSRQCGINLFHGVVKMATAIRVGDPLCNGHELVSVLFCLCVMVSPTPGPVRWAEQDTLDVCSCYIYITQYGSTVYVGIAMGVFVLSTH